MRPTAGTIAAALVTLALIAAGNPGTLRAQPQVCPCDPDPSADCWNTWITSNAYRVEGCIGGDVSGSLNGSDTSCTIDTRCKIGSGWKRKATSWTGDIDDVPYLVNCSGNLKVYPC